MKLEIKQLIIQYVEARQHQDESDNALSVALSAINPYNSYLGGTCRELTEGYQTTLTYLTKDTPYLMDWIDYWMFECNYGKSDHSFGFAENKTPIVINTLTLSEYLDIYSK